MKVRITVHATKSPKDDEERAFMGEIQANGKLEQWRQESEAALREHLQRELDDPDVLDVSVTIEDGKTATTFEAVTGVKLHPDDDELPELQDCVICGDDPEYRDSCTACGGTGKKLEKGST